MLQSISKMPEADEQIMLQVFQIILTYAGLGQNGTVVNFCFFFLVLRRLIFHFRRSY